jgi:hypothetical protein
MPTTWSFVDQPVASPTVLLNMNDGATWKTLGGDFFKLPAPPLKRSIAANAMSDGGVVSSAAYDLRTLTFTLELTAATEAGREAQMDALKAQLAKPTNLLMFQSELSANPVFFRTLRSDDYNLDTQFIPTTTWRVDCNILAEPFAIGIRRDLATVTVTNDPAAASVPSRWDMTGIVGDSPTPAFIRIGTALGPGNPVILAQRTANNPTAVTVFAQAEAGTMGTDTTVQANDTGMSGSGSNFVRCSFSTSSSLVTRLTVTAPTATDAAALRGRYRVYARTRTSATGSNFTVRYVSNVGGANSVNGPQVSFDSLASTEFRYTDLGVLEFPGPGPIPAAMGYSGLAAQVATQPLGIQIQRNSGTGTLDIDHIYLMPADERLSITSRNAQVTNSYLVIDGPSEMAYGMAPSTTPFGSTRTVDGGGGLVSMMGGSPMLVPGVTNRWYMLRGGSGVTTTSPVDVSYWPRWREVATS